jgi:hypothetical protein
VDLDAGNVGRMVTMSGRVEVNLENPFVINEQMSRIYALFPSAM